MRKRRLSLFLSPFCFGRHGGRLGPVDQDAPEGRSRTHLDGLVGRPGAIRGRQGTVHAAELRARVEQGSGPLPDAHLELAVGGPQLDRTAHYLADPDGAAGGLGGDPRERPVDRDVAVGGVAAQVAGDLAKPGDAVEILDHGGAVDLADADLAGPADIRPAHRSVDGDAAGAGAQLERARLVESEIAGPGGQPALAEPTSAAEVAQRSLAVD